MSWIVKVPLRIANALIAWWWWWMETFVDWLVGAIARTEYVRKGSCRRCGRCCRLLALEMPRWAEKSPLIIRMLNWWHDWVLNFEFQGQSQSWLVYRCRYFIDAVEDPDVSQNERPMPRCRIHWFRHRLCRFYPRQRQFGHPKLHTDCGFSFIRRDGNTSFDEILRSKRKQ